jgi:hypothetical protein
VQTPDAAAYLPAPQSVHVVALHAAHVEPNRVEHSTQTASTAAPQLDAWY